MCAFDSPEIHSFSGCSLALMRDSPLQGWRSRPRRYLMNISHNSHSSCTTAKESEKPTRMLVPRRANSPTYPATPMAAGWNQNWDLSASHWVPLWPLGFSAFMVCVSPLGESFFLILTQLGSKKVTFHIKQTHNTTNLLAKWVDESFCN